ncbi:hypothetical protein PV04_07482 [Phialophora macrospora]|uniref:Myb-like domain-containing protein n=1 Tax=Phialophora macrospora TaxID=1851006 RepID=A0A0D2FB08_9EURO|nr:hypothetical protein PV04_07482 [Phialophora macrospora]
MVHADHDEPSFFSNGANHIQRQVYQLYHTAPPTTGEAFGYLDEQPGTHQEYLELLHPSDPSGSLNPFFGAGAGSETDLQDSATAQRFFPQPDDGVQEDLWQLVSGAEEAAGEVEFEIPLNLEDFLVDDATDSEVAPQAGPEVLPDNIDANSIDSDDVDPRANSDDDGNANGATIISNRSVVIDSNDADPVANNGNGQDTNGTTTVDNRAANTASNDTSGAATSADILPYPAPAHLVAASRGQPAARAWALWEEDACIRHMLDIHREGQIQGEARFAEALRRMRVVDGCKRTAGGAVKNFWNRKGRLRSQFDERRNKRAPLATSQQGKRTAANRARTGTASKQRYITTSARVTKSHTCTQRRQKTAESSSEESEESDFVVESDNEEPGHVRHSRKRKDRDDDNEDDYQPSPTLINSVAKGLRTPKRVRSTAAW